MFHIIDTHFLDLPNAIAVFLLETSAGPVLFETGPHSTLPYLEKGLKQLGYELKDIHHVFLTHIHLDHAGAAWVLAGHGANIYVHPFGRKHLADPSRLMESARRIYKDDMDRLWGSMKAIKPEQLIESAHKECFVIGDTKIESYHTPGHAVHHIAWKIGEDLIAGDVAGVKINAGIPVPPCPPPDINIEDWQESINLIRGLDISKIYLTHFGTLTNINGHLDHLEDLLLRLAKWMKPHFENQSDPKDVTELLKDYMKNELLNNGVPESDLPVYEAANPSWMSVAGLLRYWRKKVEKKIEIKKHFSDI